MERQKRHKVDFTQPDCEQRLREIALTVISQPTTLTDAPRLEALKSYVPRRTLFKQSLAYSPEEEERIDRIYDEALIEHNYGPKDQPSKERFEPGPQLIAGLRQAVAGKDDEQAMTAVVEYLIEHSTQGTQIRSFMQPPQMSDRGRALYSRGAPLIVVENMDRTGRVDLLAATEKRFEYVEKYP